MLGLEVLLVSVWEPVFLSPAERGKGRGWKGVVQFVLKDIVHAENLQTHF